jgi:hypothetical protein
LLRPREVRSEELLLGWGAGVVRVCPVVEIHREFIVCADMCRVAEKPLIPLGSDQEDAGRPGRDLTRRRPVLWISTAVASMSA